MNTEPMDLSSGTASSSASDAEAVSADVSGYAKALET